MSDLAEAVLHDPRSGICPSLVPTLRCAHAPQLATDDAVAEMEAVLISMG